MECPDCGSEYKSVGIHIGRSDCSWPDPTDRQWNVLIGLNLGDGGLIKDRKARNPYFKIKMVNKEFLEWVDDELGWMSTGMTLEVTGEELEETHGMDDCKDQYRVQTRSMQQLVWLDWYEDDGKEFPDWIQMTPLVAKLWYVCDGGVAKEYGNATVKIASVNEMGRPEYLESLFKDVGFNPKMSGHTLRFKTDEAQDFLDWIGEPVPGFEYKWDI